MANRIVGYPPVTAQAGALAPSVPARQRARAGCGGASSRIDATYLIAGGAHPEKAGGRFDRENGHRDRIRPRPAARLIHRCGADNCSIPPRAQQTAPGLNQAQTVA